MPDLFVANKSFKQQCRYLRKLVRNKIGKDKQIKLFSGNKDVIGNCILLVANPPPKNRFKSQKDIVLYSLLREKKIYNYFLMYHSFDSKERYTRNDVKDSRTFIDISVSIIRPVIIICLGELSQLSFFNKKFRMEEYHGQKIGEYDAIEVYTTYDSDYYIKKSMFEDNSHKNNIKNIDWDNIYNKYKKRVK